MRFVAPSARTCTLLALSWVPLAACAIQPRDELDAWRAWADEVREGRATSVRDPRALPAAAPVGAASHVGASLDRAELQDAALRGLVARTRVNGFAVDDEESLRRVVDGLRTITGLPLVVHPLAEEAALDHGAVFAFDLRHPMRADDVLDLVVEQAGPEVSWTVRGEAVLVTTRERAAGELRLAQYDIRDLTMALTSFPGPRIDRIRLLDELEDDDGIGPFGGVGETVQRMEEDEVTTLVEEHVAPGTWSDPGVSITAENGILFVRQSAAVHAEIQRFLDGLRAFS